MNDGTSLEHRNECLHTRFICSDAKISDYFGFRVANSFSVNGGISVSSALYHWSDDVFEVQFADRKFTIGPAQIIVM